jgi:hypothetical protein
MSFEQTLGGALLLLVGAVLWLLAATRGTKPPLERHFQLLASAASLALALGALAAAYDVLGLFSVLLAVFSFAVGFLLLTYLHRTRALGPQPMTLEEIARERSRLAGLEHRTRERLLRHEIDEKEFARELGDVEMERAKVDAREKELRAKEAKPAPPAGPPQPPAQPPRPPAGGS